MLGGVYFVANYARTLIWCIDRRPNFTGFTCDNLPAITLTSWLCFLSLCCTSKLHHTESLYKYVSEKSYSIFPFNLICCDWAIVEVEKRFYNNWRIKTTISGLIAPFSISFTLNMYGFNNSYIVLYLVLQIALLLSLCNSDRNSKILETDMPSFQFFSCIIRMVVSSPLSTAIWLRTGNELDK